MYILYWGKVTVPFKSLERSLLAIRSPLPYTWHLGASRYLYACTQTCSLPFATQSNEIFRHVSLQYMFKVPTC